MGLLLAALEQVVRDHVPIGAVACVPAGIFLLQPGPLRRPYGTRRIPPDGGPPRPDAALLAVVVVLDVVEEDVPIPRGVEAQVLHLAVPLPDHPFVHELLERHVPLFERDVVIHRDADGDREQAPDPPQRDVHRLLRFLFAAVADHDLDGRRAELGVAGLVRLDARDQVREGVVAHVRGVGREPDHLEVGERGLEREGDHDRGGHGVAGHHDVVHRVAAAEHRPVPRVLRPVGPVILAVAAHQLVREVELELGVTQLVQHPVDGHVAHGRRRTEAGHPGLELAGLVFRQRHRAVVELQHARPALVGLIVELRPRQRRLHRIGGGILLALDVHVFPVGDLVGFVEGFPLGERNAVGIAHGGRKKRLPRDVGRGPVGVPRDVVPVRALEHCRHPRSQPACRSVRAFSVQSPPHASGPLLSGAPRGAQRSLA